MTSVSLLNLLGTTSLTIITLCGIHVFFKVPNFTQTVDVYLLRDRELNGISGVIEINRCRIAA